MRSGAYTLDDLDVDEADTIVFPFTGWVPAGLAIASASVDVAVLVGIDATPGLLLLGTPQIVGTEVHQAVLGRLAGVTYKLRCRAVVSDAKMRVSSALLKVVRL